MINKNNSKEVLEQLGNRLKEARLHRNETQETFAARIDLSRQSYAKMEKGEGSVPISKWVAASEILGLLGTWSEVLVPETDLFSRFEREKKGRQRARSAKK